MAAETERPVFEPAEVSRPWLVGGAIIGFFLFAAILMGILLAAYLRVAAPPAPPQKFPQPQLQPYPQADLRDFMRGQREKLEQSGWIDKSAGIAAIPVDKAMKIIAGRGKSAFDPLPEAAPGSRKGGAP